MAVKTSLVIVESPTKAKTIRKFLPKSFVVEASMGHIRDLPDSADEIPKELRGTEWARLGVNVEDDFSPLYVVPKGKSKIVSELRKKLKDADEVFLATDEDREGESISWHLLSVLKPKVPVKRMVFHEITKSAIERALLDTRAVDEKLVRAQETRRVLDRLVGYTISPLIWKKIAFGLSAGRVQSVGLRVIVQRERERLRFQKAEYWDLEALLEKVGSPAFSARLTGLSGKRVATGKDFDETTGKLRDGKDVVLVTEDQARKLVASLKPADFVVGSVEDKPNSARPSPPFITSTLQQEANRKLGLSSRDAMRVAQALYEQGFITYMRTDSPALSQEAIKAAREQVADLYGKDYLSAEVRQYSSKAKGAQEAHECIRPAGASFVHPRETGLSGRELALYDLIWKRTVATQMAEAKKLTVVAKFNAGEAQFQASGTRILFPGFLRAYVEGSDDPEAALEDREVLLPDLKVGEKVPCKKLDAQSHETKPPARFTEASLIQMLEKEGVGRPSTYASIIDTILHRGYVRKVGNALVPSFTGFAVTQFLEKHFERIVDISFTSKMEQSLDDIAEGNLESLPYLKNFYLGKTGLSEQVKEREKQIDPDESRSVDLGIVQGVQVKIGRYGPYVVADDVHASIPEDIAPADLNAELVKDIIEQSKKGPQSIGQDPKTGLDIYCLLGRFGPYVQLGQVTEEAPKPRRASVPKGIDLKTVTLAQALQWLSLPRELGLHPVSNEPVLTNNGRFGPYVVHQKDFRSLKKEDNVYTVTLERALELLAQEKKSRAGAAQLREVGAHPSDGKPIGLYDGKYGMYVKHGDVNATLPKDVKPEDLTVEQAVALLAERAGKGGKAKAKAPARKPASASVKKASAKSAAEKSVVAKPVAKAVKVPTSAKGVTQALAQTVSKVVKKKAPAKGGAKNRGG
jgi:DNA topoisomerase-1